MEFVDERGVKGLFEDVVAVYPAAGELFFPPRVEQDLTFVCQLQIQTPEIPIRLQSYLDMGVDPWEWITLPGPRDLDTYPREKIISAFMQEYCPVGAENWVDRVLEYYPEKLPLVEFIRDIRRPDFTPKEILMQVLERPEITNDEICVVGW